MASPASNEDFDAPEEFPQAEGFEVADLVTKGNRAFRAKRFDEAIDFYCKAQALKPGDSIVLANRSAALCRISQALRNRPPSESEWRPLNGLDPTAHAELALIDAEKVMTLRSNSAKSYFLKGNALVLLERYDEAREALLLGLHVNPLSYSLQKSLQDFERIVGSSAETSKQRKLQRSDDFECTVCFKLMYEPLTTPCGHSFCRSCLFQSMDHGNKCPMCRTVLFISPRTYPISVTLNNIIQKHFPEEFAERKAEQERLTNLGVDILPLFVMDVILPCQKLALNIFEPRYRLMVRRIMEGNHRMGMAVIDSTNGSVAEYACEVEITECKPLPDGRFYLEIEGRRRFRILRSWDQDGYRVAEVEWMQDLHPPEGTPSRENLRQEVSQAAELAQECIRRAHGSKNRRVREIALKAEGMPGPRDPELFSFWLVNLLNLRPSEKYELLYLRDTRERISRGRALLGAAGLLS